MVDHLKHLPVPANYNLCVGVRLKLVADHHRIRV